ncbi:hypothetical protein GQ44DRAFT_617694 [Phaeosphaeriaceae sp. PMI808]|nr:hypothetical protein GQ44DRAFT_617694 [Phaeosphaeriaceae sp. PMI808]
MKYSTATILAASAALVSASPIAQTDAPSTPTVFRLMALRSGSEIHFRSVQALESRYVIGAPAQGASCGPEPKEWASFGLTPEGDLYLYSPNPPLQAYVDRSGMGQGFLGYTTGVQPIGHNQRRGPFKIDENDNLVYMSGNDSVGFQACPGGVGGGWTIWMAGEINPGGHKDCLGFTARVQWEANATKCSYTTRTEAV